MKWPDGSPAWLKQAVEDLDDQAQRAILQEEPARACGFNACLIELKRAIEASAESEEQRRLKQLHDLTWGADGKPAS